MAQERLIFHIDVNSAFLSWEAVRRVRRGEEDLRLIPSAVGGDPKSRRGIIVAKSIPAKKFGVTTGEPVSMALKKCPQLVLVKSDFRLYSKCSKAFKDICREYAPAVEEFSIDECFLDLTGTSQIYPDPIALAYEIKDKIRDELGFTVNVGVARNKLCAKMASDFEKPDRVHTLFPEEVKEKMWPLPVRDLLFVGKKSAERLNGGGIRTIGDLAQADPRYLRSLLGEKMSEQARAYANGIDESPVRPEPEVAKGFSNEVTLEDDVTTPEAAATILLELADHVTARMRRDGAKAQCVAVSVRYLDFKTRSHQRRLDAPTDISREVYETAGELLAELWNGEPLRLMGVALTQLTRGEDSARQDEQLSFFGEGLLGSPAAGAESGGGKIDREKERKLDAAMDELRDRFGSGAVRRGGAMAMGIRVARKASGQNDAEREEQTEL
ncbi:MAG: DNA polymerase IV [Lachnospiraceae bacterium]|nr:DNA polymerase IV [Lachnospiraceae bacterium]